jgi:hypothetical protein
MSIHVFKIWRLYLSTIRRAKNLQFIGLHSFEEFLDVCCLEKDSQAADHEIVT